LSGFMKWLFGSPDSQIAKLKPPALQKNGRRRLPAQHDKRSPTRMAADPERRAGRLFTAPCMDDHGRGLEAASAPLWRGRGRCQP
jgi:hypothetical protein